MALELYGEGYKVSDICESLNISRSRFYRDLSLEYKNLRELFKRAGTSSLNYELLQLIKELKCKHPYCGYRRICAYMRVRLKYSVNAKRIYRVMRENRLLNDKEKKLKASRVYKSKPQAERPREYPGIDATKF